jgi:hypothetical protein
MKTIKLVLTFIAVVILYPFYLIASPFNFTAKKVIWDLNDALRNFVKSYYLRLSMAIK